MAALTNTRAWPIEDGVASASNGSFLVSESENQLTIVAMNKDNSLTTDELFMVYNHIKFLEEQQNEYISMVQCLRSELDEAYAKIQELEFEQRLSRKETEHLIKRYTDDKGAWRAREHQRIREAVNSMREELENEKRARRKMESVNRKLSKQMEEMRQDRESLLKEIEMERKAKQVLEEICEELAKEIGHDKARAEELMRESAQYREEVEEEKRMLQMAELMREERIHMKLEEARLFVEEQSMSMENLKSEVEDFINSQRSCKSDATCSSLSRAESLRDAINSLKIQEVVEQLSSAPYASEEGFSGDEDMHCIDITGGEMDSRSSKKSNSKGKHVQSEKPLLVEEFKCEGVSKYLGSMHSKASHGKEQGSHMEDIDDWDSSSSEREDEEPKKFQQDFEVNSPDYFQAEIKRAYTVDEDDDGDDMSEATVNYEETDRNLRSVYSNCLPATECQSRKEAPILSYPWKTSPVKKDFCYKAVPAKVQTPILKSVMSPQMSNMNESNAKCKPSMKAREPTNPHVSRGIKGYIEWPKGVRQNSLQARLLEARMETQKQQKISQNYGVSR